MQSVADHWYITYSRVSMGFAYLFLAAWAATSFAGPLKGHQKTFGLSETLIIIVAVHLLYAYLLYARVVKKHGLPLGTTIIALINSLGILSLIQATGSTSSLYLSLWTLLMLVLGMFGTYALGAGVFMMAAYTVIVTSDVYAQGHLVTPLMFIPLVVAGLAAVASHFLWREVYVNAENVQLERLSGMLKNKQQQAEILMESLADGVVVTTVDGRISLINHVACRMTGWTQEEATGLDFKLVLKLKQEKGEEIPPKLDPFNVALNNQNATQATLQLVSKDEKQTIVSISASPIVAANSPPMGVVAVMRDVSVARREEQQRADFISTASHEMRTPVAAIEGYLALALNERVAKIDPKARSYLEKAHESTQHLGKLFQDLLTSAKAEDGRLASHPIVIEMGAYIEQLTDSFKFSAQKKGLLTDFIVGISPGNGNMPPIEQTVVKPLYYVHADPDRLREVITNLFDNAVKYTPSGKVSLGLTGNDEVVQLFVRDTGPGIPKEDIPHLFQKFYRVDNSATRTIGGTGLGLFICRKIIELYNGRIWAESEVDKGSTFYINLPRLTQTKATEMMTTEAQTQEPAPVTSLTTPVM